MVASMHKNESLYLDCPGFAMALQGPGCESFASHGHGVFSWTRCACNHARDQEICWRGALGIAARTPVSCIKFVDGQVANGGHESTNPRIHEACCLRVWPWPLAMCGRRCTRPHALPADRNESTRSLLFARTRCMLPPPWMSKWDLTRVQPCLSCRRTALPRRHRQPEGKTLQNP